MLLRNYDNLMAAYSLASTDTLPSLQNASTWDDSSLTIKGMDGSVTTIRIYYPNSCIPPLKSFVNKQGWYGSGEGTTGYCSIIPSEDATEPSYDDYTMPYLGGDKIQYLRLTLSDIEYNAEAKTWSRKVSQTILALDNLEINSIGVYQANDGNKPRDMKTLLFRKKLDAPVVVPANANFVLSFTTTVSANPNKPTNYDATANIV